jgi:hypothetical protein
MPPINKTTFRDMHFRKEDMKGTYKWAENNENSIFNGQPSRRVFDRYNGDQVLFIINFYGSLSGRSSIQESQQIEEKIYNHLPLEKKSELSVFNWIRNELFQ